MIFGLNIINLSILSLTFFTALTVIFSSNPVVSVFNLIILYVIVALYLMYLGITYIGVSYIIIYIGAIAILFLFIIMMIDVEITFKKYGNYIPLLAFSFITLILCLILSFNKLHVDYNNLLFFSTNWDSAVMKLTQISILGDFFYSNYHAFIYLLSIILLLAMIGAIILTANFNSNNRSANNITFIHLSFSFSITPYEYFAFTFAICLLGIQFLFLYYLIWSLNRSSYNIKSKIPTEINNISYSNIRTTSIAEINTTSLAVASIVRESIRYRRSLISKIQNLEGEQSDVHVPDILSTQRSYQSEKSRSVMRIYDERLKDQHAKYFKCITDQIELEISKTMFDQSCSREKAMPTQRLGSQTITIEKMRSQNPVESGNEHRNYYTTNLDYQEKFIRDHAAWELEQYRNEDIVKRYYPSGTRNKNRVTSSRKNDGSGSDVGSTNSKNSIHSPCENINMVMEWFSIFNSYLDRISDFFDGFISSIYKPIYLIADSIKAQENYLWNIFEYIQNCLEKEQINIESILANDLTRIKLELFLNNYKDISDIDADGSISHLFPGVLLAYLILFMIIIPLFIALYSFLSVIFIIWSIRLIIPIIIAYLTIPGIISTIKLNLAISWMRLKILCAKIKYIIRRLCIGNNSKMIVLLLPFDTTASWINFEIYFYIILILAVILWVVNLLFSLRILDMDKGRGFECGLQSFFQTREQFHISFHRVSLLFLAFDLEIVIIYPSGGSDIEKVAPLFFNLLIFILILMVGFIYEISVNALDIFINQLINNWNIEYTQ